MERNPRKKKTTNKKKSIFPLPVTWDNVKIHADFMYSLLTKYGKIAPPLPFGEHPTAIVNLKCDEFLGQLFKANRVQTTMPPEIAPWILARMITAITMVSTSAANRAPKPKAKTIEDVLFELTVKDWNDCLFLLWSIFGPTDDGKGVRINPDPRNFGKGLDPMRFSEN